MIVSFQVNRTIRVGKTEAKRIEEHVEARVCLACDCKVEEDRRYLRGLCEGCHRATLRAIARGDFSEEDRIKKGKLLAKASGGRKPTNPVTIDARGLD